jgi:hypothetical protein
MSKRERQVPATASLPFKVQAKTVLGPIETTRYFPINHRYKIIHSPQLKNVLS